MDENLKPHGRSPTGSRSRTLWLGGGRGKMAGSWKIDGECGLQSGEEYRRSGHRNRSGWSHHKRSLGGAASMVGKASRRTGEGSILTIAKDRDRDIVIVSIPTQK